MPTFFLAGSASRSSTLYQLFLVTFLLFQAPPISESVIDVTSSSLPCESDEFCQDLMQREDTICLPSQKCSNPFYQGCFYKLGTQKALKKKRICNSDDGGIPQKEMSGGEWPCVEAEFDYPEIRIHSADFYGSIFQAWIYQIVLMEILGVPATVGLSNENTKLTSFYNIESTIELTYPRYPMYAMDKANQVEECHLTDEPCVHVLPDVSPWQEDDVYNDFIVNGTVESPIENGIMADLVLSIPRFTAEQFPAAAIHYGLRGEENRQFLAEAFKRPVKWLDYCQNISSSRCREPDETASRRPIPWEEGLYFREGFYTGYFQATEKNDCSFYAQSSTDMDQNSTDMDQNSTGTDQNSTYMTCTGHVVAPPCAWAVNLEGLLYWNDIVGLEIDGPNPPNNGYTAYTMEQIWRAANATKSHVMMVVPTPGVFAQNFYGTDAEPIQVMFPSPDYICLDNRTPLEDRCSENITDRRGDPRGACGSRPAPFLKLLASSFGENSKLIPDADQSPAYEFIRQFRFSDLELNNIYADWLSMGGDRRSALHAREAVCEWVTTHLDIVFEYVPIGYPRIVSREDGYKAMFLYFCLALGILSAMTSVVCMILCQKYKKSRVIVYAQPVFLRATLIGFFLVSIGAVLEALKPTNGTCISVVWFVILGYNIELVPLLVKTAAINQLKNSQKKRKKVNISRRRLLQKVGWTLAMVITYLSIWTALDPPLPVTARVIYPDSSYPSMIGDPDKPGTVVSVDVQCASEGDWRLIALIWQVLLLVMSAVLAFQTRGVLKEFNESRSMGLLTYSHFMFLILEFTVNLVSFGNVPPSTIQGLFSLIYSLDSLFSMCIYVIPKIFLAITVKETRRSGSTSRVESVDTIAGGDKLKVLVCTANVGNAQPNSESMEGWIPLDGECALVTSLDGTKMDEGNFDLIVIGMQEATWTEKASQILDKLQHQEEEASEFDDSDVLNALEDHHTAALREMIQETLGDEYTPVAEDQRGQMRLYIYALNHVVENIDDLRITGANTGIGNVLANKGGIVITLTYRKTRMSFVSAHLAAHEGESHYKARCDNVRSILKEGKTFDLSSKLDVAISSHHVFFIGDLNFRTNFGREKTDTSHDENVDQALGLIEAKDFKGLYSFDELHKGVEKGDLLFGFQTLPCHFPPTFKVLREKGVAYKRQRTPSYTDRILFKSAPGLGGNLRPLAYEPCVDFITSDHKPIRGAFSLTTNAVNGPFTKKGLVRFVFRDMKGFDLPGEDRSGKSDPYLMFFWDGVELSTEKTSMKDKLRTIFRGRSWPRTSYISQNLNPDWEGETVSLVAKDPVISTDAMLYVVVMDFDSVAFRDTFLGAVALNVKDIVVASNRQQPQSTPNAPQSPSHHAVEHVFDRTVERHGLPTGRISFKLDVEMEQNRGRMARIANMFSNRNIISNRNMISERNISSERNIISERTVDA